MELFTNSQVCLKYKKKLCGFASCAGMIPRCKSTKLRQSFIKQKAQSSYSKKPNFHYYRFRKAVCIPIGSPSKNSPISINMCIIWKESEPFFILHEKKKWVIFCLTFRVGNAHLFRGSMLLICYNTGCPTVFVASAVIMSCLGQPV